jgi:hypothetical protein
MRPTETRHIPPTPIWLAALVATGCQAVSDRDRHEVGWRWSMNHAIYTNVGTTPERIDPLGVTLAGGETLSVTWIPGETAYTIYVDAAPAKCA